MRWALVCFVSCVLSVLEAEVKQWPIVADVLSVNEAEGTLTLSDVQGLGKGAPALLSKEPLIVQVHPGDIQVGYANRAIRAQLMVKDETPRLEYIWPNDARAVQVAGDVNRALALDTVTRGRRVYRGVGEFIPDFAFYDQAGDLVRKSTLRGKMVVLNFIFSRCQVAKMCPAATARMVRLQREAKEAGVKKLQLVSVSFDPDYDTPGVLNYYGSQRGIDFANFSLLTGDKQTVQNLMKQFGILVFPEDNTLNHSMATILIDDKGKIVYRRDGSRWSTQDFVERLQALETPSSSKSK